MKQSEAKRIFIEVTNKELESFNFNLKKTRNINAIYIRKKENGYEDLGISTYNYYPEVVFGIGTSKRLNEVEEILWEINEKHNMNLKLSNDTWTISYFGNRSKRKLELMEVKNRDNEKGVKESIKILMGFIKNEVLPTYDLFDDLREIDKRINGQEENLWEDDSGNFKPFSFGTYFGYRRLIIARLSKQEEDFNVFLEKIYSLRDKKAEKFGVTKIDKNDLSNKTNIVIKYLKENVSPIY
ncbi:MULTISPECIES: hypothetical protein [Mesonia]|uniref:Uncharacterized protein n=1 Tax=Mesonia oceanica TaxID=2687242 RepID=A0AC61YCX8_9FLAO|nr:MULTISPECIES: hypothetical protein [Mesonia]MAN29035.1 hypothetical protein [Mesonia sp.]MBJ96587.1 hypothetical protein [Flavobacteriaceae bacterium]VVV01280.1 hypothetical protein FVB9532_02570 [Mesonia oceanica]|tara:strand:+ start:7086 stop:7805 length:720 start_codon:yes stop_codon:yes gene_type:complete